MNVMHIEHEEAMREAFTELDRLTRMAYRPEATEADIHRLYTEGAAIDHGWHHGPHREQWWFLKNARAQWVSDPDVMRRALVESLHTPGGKLDAVQRRSIEQGRVLAAADATRPEIERGR
ncbi:hypothetical protein ACIBG0_40320 [Nocardia sp. NPDC050630]|uniref:hypothetical protein n=1 Tax=Nocardia sp. NPDC050630 TaxID=3364321 RepID=UPI003798F107